MIPRASSARCVLDLDPCPFTHDRGYIRSRSLAVTHGHARSRTVTHGHSRSLTVTRSGDKFPSLGGTAPFWSLPTPARSNPPGDAGSDRHNGLPNYGLKVGRLPDYSLPNYSTGVGQPPKNNQGVQWDVRGQRKGLGKKAWWRYTIPTASSFSGYLSEVRDNISPGAVPQYGGGDGGKGGSGGGGWGGRGDGNGDEPMKGWTYAFALIVVVGGIMGYVRKGSTQSLVVSSGVAVLLLIAASLMGVPTSKVGTILALATAVGLAAMMGIKAKKTRKMIPAVVSVYSAAMACGYMVTLM